MTDRKEDIKKEESLEQRVKNSKKDLKPSSKENQTSEKTEEKVKKTEYKTPYKKPQKQIRTKKKVVKRANANKATASAIINAVIIGLGIAVFIWALCFASTSTVISYIGAKTEAYGMAYFRYFASISNIVMILAAVVMFVFNILTLYKGYKVTPKWAEAFYQIGVTCVVVNLLAVVFVLIPMKGTNFAYIKNEAIFLNFVCPVLAIINYIFIQTEHKTGLKESIASAIIPTVYGIVYTNQVIAVKAWKDFYSLSFIAEPWAPVAIVVALAVSAFAVAYLMGLAHNYFVKVTEDRIAQKVKEQKAKRQQGK